MLAPGGPASPRRHACLAELCSGGALPASAALGIKGPRVSTSSSISLASLSPEISSQFNRSELAVANTGYARLVWVARMVMNFSRGFCLAAGIQLYLLGKHL